MGTCEQCRKWLDALIDDVVQAVLGHGYHGYVCGQQALARHIAIDHPAEVPGPHDGCEACAGYAAAGSAEDLWREHRARSLFLPEDIARLL
jgi:hypothetical protein